MLKFIFETAWDLTFGIVSACANECRWLTFFFSVTSLLFVNRISTISSFFLWSFPMWSKMGQNEIHFFRLISSKNFTQNVHMKIKMCMLDLSNGWPDYTKRVSKIYFVPKDDNFFLWIKKTAKYFTVTGNLIKIKKHCAIIYVIIKCGI